uniref:Ig-like domain-containing protein n=1 Tax=Sinocyclocheilus rhinocerous TaxID=307959 RepID=A0A673NBB1_9TELE
RGHQTAMKLPHPSKSFLYLCDLLLCIVFFHCLVPTTVSASVRSNVTLPCYARTEKQIADDTVNILWKKDDQTVVQVQKGITTYGSGFKGRASVSLHHYKDGDLSLNILRVTTSDKGLYRCYHRDTEEHGYPTRWVKSLVSTLLLWRVRFKSN